MAVTLEAELIVTVQLLVPLHPAPDQSVKVELVFGVAVSVTSVPLAKEALQLPAGQLMPVGLEATAPAPLPVRVTLCA
nr:hypothetical protein [Archangium lipolyticum]